MDQSVSYQWFGPNGTVLSTDSSLLFTPLKESHRGDYSCQVALGSGDGQRFGCWSESILPLHFASSPNIVVRVNSGTAVAGRLSTLTCQISGVNLANSDITVMYTWLKDGRVVQAPVASVNTYNITPVQVSNAGELYTCQVVVRIPYYDVNGPLFASNGTSSPLAVTST